MLIRLPLSALIGAFAFAGMATAQGVVPDWFRLGGAVF